MRIAAAIVATPETSANAPNTAINADRPTFGQMRMTTANAIASAPRNAVTFQMWASACSPSFRCVSRFISLLLSLQLRGQFGGLLFELLACRRHALPLLRPGVAGGSTRLREPLVDRQAAGADGADRRLGLLACLPGLRRNARLQPLEVVVPAAELSLDGVRERRPVVGDVCRHRMLGNDEPRLQPAELLLDLVGSRTRRGCDRCLLVVECVEVTLDPQSLRGGVHLRERLQPLDPAAELGKLVLDCGCAHSSLLFV